MFRIHNSKTKAAMPSSGQVLSRWSASQSFDRSSVDENLIYRRYNGGVGHRNQGLMRFALAIVIAISVVWGSVAGAVARTSTHSMAASMADCAHKAKTECPCDTDPGSCAKAYCSMVCGQMVGLIDSAVEPVVRVVAVVINFSSSAFRAMTPEFEPPIPRN